MIDVDGLIDYLESIRENILTYPPNTFKKQFIVDLLDDIIREIRGEVE